MSLENRVLETLVSWLGLPETIPVRAAHLDPSGLGERVESGEPGSIQTTAMSIADSRLGRVDVYRSLPAAAGRGIPSGIHIVAGEEVGWKFVSVLSSRLDRSPDQHPEWFAAMRTYCVRIGPGACLMIHPEQYTYRYLRRLVELIGIRCVVLLQCAAEDLRQALETADAIRRQSPNSVPTFLIRVVERDEDRLPADACVAAYCHEIRVIHLRRQGHIHRLLSNRTAKLDDDGTCRTYLLWPSTRRQQELAQPFIDRGAIRWQIVDSQLNVAADRPTWPSDDTRQSARIVQLRDFDSTPYVAHFTRRQRGAWADETESHYLDSLLLGERQFERSPLGTLARIIVQQLLIADNSLTRSAERVVCFSNRSLAEFRDLRVFRSHLARWDFEPYGIAIKREVLRACGGRPVAYGSEADWERMKPSERAFFQIARGDRDDWTVEDEWRVVGDLDLRFIAADDGIVFVSTIDDARSLAPLSRWPIVTLNE